jgi:hypothetical protein
VFKHLHLAPIKNNFLCPFLFYFEFEIFVVVLDMGVICAQFFVKNVYSWEREGFLGFQ